MASSRFKSLLVIGTLLLVLAAALTSVACRRSERVAATQPKLRVGAIIPLTGEVATYGEALRRGFDLAAAEQAERIEVVYQDSKASPKDGASAMQMLLSSGIRHFLGDATSGVCLALAPLAEESQSLLMISIATSDALTEAGKMIFRNCPPNRKQAAAAATFISRTLGLHRVAILSKTNPYGENLAAQFKIDAAAAGLTIVSDNRYDQAARDFSVVVQKVKASGAEAVFMPGNYEETAAILKRAREIGLAIPLIGTDGAYSPQLMALAGPAAEGFYLTMLGVDEASPYYRRFREAYELKYGESPDVFSAYGYEGAMILFQVMLAAPTVQAQRQLLETGEWDGLLGRVSFDRDGEIVREVQVLTVRGGSFVRP